LGFGSACQPLPLGCGPAGKRVQKVQDGKKSAKLLHKWMAFQPDEHLSQQMGLLIVELNNCLNYRGQL